MSHTRTGPHGDTSEDASADKNNSGSSGTDTETRTLLPREGSRSQDAVPASEQSRGAIPKKKTAPERDEEQSDRRGSEERRRTLRRRQKSRDSIKQPQQDQSLEEQGYDYQVGHSCCIIVPSVAQ